MVVAQFVERLFLTPEVCGLNPVIGKLLITYLLSTVLKKRKQKKKRLELAQFFLK